MPYHRKHLGGVFASRVALIALAACASPGAQTSNGATAAAPARDCTPVETRSPNATGQTPAFPGQTRTCGVHADVAFDVVVVASGLEHPWSVEPLPDGRFLVTERPGRMRIVSASGQLGEPIEGIPAVAAAGQGGLLDVALSPGFASDRTIFWTFSEPREGGNGTAIARGVLSADGRRVDDVRVIFHVQPTYAGRQHFGSRIAFGPDGMLYASFGERSDTPMRRFAQALDAHLGKSIRIRPDGSVPSDNPFAARADAKPEIWTLGHRNPQGLAFDPEGRLWQVEHGTRGGDELDLLEKGKNYGWPLQAYGIEYSGKQPISSPLGDAAPHVQGMQEPTYFWDPVIAPSGLQFYTGNAFPAWHGNAFIGGLGSKRLVRLVLDGTRVTGEEHLLVDRAKRVRDVRQGPDGLLYLVTDEQDGELLKLAPKG